ncbi:hypothetical protein [Amycolatopsis lurida]|uniref:hypothetical protein n=1 Tax=Amycolatopsis lurida TaxID=31959 RepID=UPI0036696006
MTRIVRVHGIEQQVADEQSLSSAWAPALQSACSAHNDTHYCSLTKTTAAPTSNGHRTSAASAAKEIADAARTQDSLLLDDRAPLRASLPGDPAAIVSVGDTAPQQSCAGASCECPR